MERWSGKVAVVTGASSGIGLAIAKALIKEKMIVVGLARRQEKMMKEMAEFEGKGLGRFYALKCDVTNEKSVQSAFDEIKKMFKQLHVLVNNAGIVRFKTIEDSTVEDLQQVNNVNFMGVLYCYKQALSLLRASEEAIIININSVIGDKVPLIIRPNSDEYVPINIYPATKFALRAVSETMTHELLASKIRVTNLSPGYVKTDITSNAKSDEVQPETANLPGLIPENIADAVLFVIKMPANVQISQLTIKPYGEKFI